MTLAHKRGNAGKMKFQVCHCHDSLIVYLIVLFIFAGAW